MKIKIQYALKTMPRIMATKKGDWFDLRSAENYNTKKGQSKMINLGVAIKLPSGFEAIMAPRSSSYKNFGFTQTNSIGIIDSSYCGPNDIWKCPVLFHRDAQINQHDRVCQFRIQLSQKAPIWAKLRWLVSSKITFKEVDKLKDKNRDGFGSTGTK